MYSPSTSHSLTRQALRGSGPEDPRAAALQAAPPAARLSDGATALKAGLPALEPLARLGRSVPSSVR